MSLFTKQLNTTYPLSKIKIKNKLNKNPWVTRTLKNSLREKYKLYKIIILKRTLDLESKYTKE